MKNQNKYLYNPPAYCMGGCPDSNNCSWKFHEGASYCASNRAKSGKRK